MRLGLIAWIRSSGMGQIFLNFQKHLPIDSTYVMGYDELLRDKLRPPFYIADRENPGPDVEKWIDEARIDTVLSWETPAAAFTDTYVRKGIRWLHGINWDVLNEKAHFESMKKASLISPNAMCRRNLESMGLASTLLPMPIDTDEFPFRPREHAHRFLSIYRKGQYARRAFDDIFTAWQTLAKRGTPPPITVTTQMPLYPDPPIPRGFDISQTVFHDAHETYELGDVLVQPSRYEGIGLTLLEAQSTGLPVITVDAEPMNWLAPDLLLPVSKEEPGHKGRRRLIRYFFEPAELVKLVEGLTGSDIRELSHRGRQRVEREFSWNALRDRWRSFLAAA